MSNPDRQKPDFIILGAMRCATTTLALSLAQHPEISMSREKETDFFIAEKNLRLGRDWYLGQFDPNRRLWGEASPNYAKGDAFEGVPERIAAFNPAVRLIYVLRDPVARAVSQYRHSWNMGALALRPEALPGSHELDHLVSVSSYAAQLSRFYEHFPREALLLVDYDDLVARPEAALARIHAHIGAHPLPEAAGWAGQLNANEDLARLPRGLLRLSQGRLRPYLIEHMPLVWRQRLKWLVARGPVRDEAPAFPAKIRAIIRDRLREDVAQLRAMTGMGFSNWSL